MCKKKQKSLLSVFHLVHLRILYSSCNSAIQVACTFYKRACFSGTETMTWPLLFGQGPLVLYQESYLATCDSTWNLPKGHHEVHARNHMFEFSLSGCRHRKTQAQFLLGLFLCAYSYSDLLRGWIWLLLRSADEGNTFFANSCLFLFITRVGAQNHCSRRVDVDAPYYRQIKMKSTGFGLKIKNDP